MRRPFFVFVSDALIRRWIYSGLRFIGAIRDFDKTPHTLGKAAACGIDVGAQLRRDAEAIGEHSKEPLLGGLVRLD